MRAGLAQASLCLGLLTVLLMLCLPAAATGPEQSNTFVFVCDDGTSYTVQTTATDAWVFRPGGSLRLSVVASDEGRQYSDGRFEVRIDGQQALLGEASGELQHCVNDSRSAVWEAAKLDGVDFRAVGNEPGWYLEIREQSRIILVADYGESRVEAPLPEPSEDAETGTTRWNAGELIVEVRICPCFDTMSGEEFSSRVVVHWRDRTLRGCGRPLH